MSIAGVSLLHGGVLAMTIMVTMLWVYADQWSTTDTVYPPHHATMPHCPHTGGQRSAHSQDEETTYTYRGEMIPGINDKQ